MHRQGNETETPRRKDLVDYRWDVTSKRRSGIYDWMNGERGEKKRELGYHDYEKRAKKEKRIETEKRSMMVCKHRYTQRYIYVSISDVCPLGLDWGWVASRVSRCISFRFVKAVTNQCNPFLVGSSRLRCACRSWRTEGSTVIDRDRDGWEEDR